jgi:uncharacterized protein YjbI with pentapeptide repeats
VGRRVVGEANFQGATFPELADFSDTVFDKALFRGATFEKGANFRRTRFKSEAQFERTTFKEWVTFWDARFACVAVFEHPEDEGEEEDEDDGSDAAGWQHEVRFCGWADFRRTRFRAGACFGGAIFESRARFGAASFGSLEEEACGSFEGARFALARTFGPMLACGELKLGRCSFEAPVRIEVAACKLSCQRAHFLSRTTLEVRFADVNLEDAEFAQPSIVAGARRRFRHSDAKYQLDDSELEVLWREDPTPRISSMNRANVENLSVANVDLERCLFSRAYNLDRLRFGEGVKFDDAKRRFRTRRVILAEETQLRHPPKDRDRADPDPPDAERIARAYRALRKGREDNKNEPGAADFYYGEMEMRRASAEGFDRVLLPLYRWVSGYGLRAWRSLAALAVTVALFAWGFQAWGFDPDAGFWDSLLFSAESTTGLFRVPSAPDGAKLTDAGHVLQMFLRLLGPLFFGLAILALRGRVKR